MTEPVDKLADFKNALTDSVADLFFYDRKNSELTVSDILDLVRAKKITQELVIEWFITAVAEAFQDNFIDEIGPP